MSKIYQVSPENQYLTETRQHLVARGYRIIPHRGKVPALVGWNSSWYLANELQDGPKGAAVDRVARWEVRFPDALTTGLRIEDGLCVVDIDCDDEEIVQGLLARLWTIAPDVAQRAPTRYGGGTHKMALFCRLDGDCEPFVRRSSRRYDGQQLEIFGGKKLKGDKCSRTFGIYGAHSVGVEYCWDESIPALHEVDPANLPMLSSAQIGTLCDAFDALCVARGWESETRPDTESAAQLYDIDEASRFNTDKGSDGIDYEQLCLEFERYGSLRCDASFTGDGGRNRSRCWVFWSPRHDCVAVYVHGEAQTHYPRDAAGVGPIGIEDAKQIKRSGQRLRIDDYYAFLPTHQYIYRHTGELWLIGAINTILNKVAVGTELKKQSKKDIAAKLPPEVREVTIPASLWLDRHRGVTQMSWAPGLPQIIAGKTTTDGGWSDVAGACIYNKYRPAAAFEGGNAQGAERWLDLIRRIYPDHVGHIVAFCAHRIQRPAEKINHGLVLTGMPGLGKDTLLEPLKHGVGAWNFKEIAPHDIIGGYNDFVCAAVLRVSEARDLGDVNRYDFYERCKTLLAAPPDMIRVNVKYVPEYYVPNIVAVIFTTNYGSDGLYLPADDRRHYVCGTDAVRSEATDIFCREMWDWYGNGGGIADVVAYLREYDLTQFDAKGPPAKTEAFWRMVDAGMASEVPEMRDALELIGGKHGAPDAMTIDMLKVTAEYDLRAWLNERKNRRTIPHRMDACGYVPVRSYGCDDGLWVMQGRRQVVYAKRELTLTERYRAAESLARLAGHKATSAGVEKLLSDLRAQLSAGNVIPLNR